MNLNKLFPRLSIRLKLAIAFVLLAIVPLAAAAVLATETAVRQLRSLATATLEHDLLMARRQTERSLQEVERDVAYLTKAHVEPLFGDATPLLRTTIAARISDFLRFDPALFQVKVIDPDGRLLVGVRKGGGGTTGGGLYYAVRASALVPGERLMLPVELRKDDGVDDSVTTVPAVAILLPIWGGDSTFLGAVVGEAYAAVLFAGLEEGSPNLRGITGLVSSDGLLLYHSAHKRDWTRLLIARGEADIRSDLPAEVVDSVLARQEGTITTRDYGIVSFVPVRLSESGIRSPVLYRVVARESFEASVTTFRRWATVGGIGVLVLVLGLAVLAARQFTQPIYQLSQEARRLARGIPGVPLKISTNDELEDLASDFSDMAAQLSEHRARLEELVAERSRALAETHAELTDILERSADAIVGLDLDRRVRVWNHGAETLFKYTAAEALNHDIDALILPSDVTSKTEKSFIERELILHGSVVNLQTRRAPKAGKPFPVSLTQTLIRDDGGAPIGYSLILRDTTVQAKLEMQMRRSERLAAISVMAAGLAHELNNPLAVIANRIECMEHEVSTRCPECFLRRDLTVLREHTHRLGEVTRDLLRFAHDDEGDEAVISLRIVSDRVTRLLSRTFASQDIRLNCVVHEDLPSPVGSEKAVETVLMNLLLNAADATPPGGEVTLQVARSTSGDAVEIAVSDTGPGIPRELSAKIFEPFFTTKGAGRGTGLGLAVCRTVVERHGGSIWAENREGGGSRFVVTLPLEPSGGMWEA
ncbi:MAG: ATP-binding protein [Gemmatimonadales bacterium]